MTAAPMSNSSITARISNPRLLLALRAAWIAIAIVLIIITALSVPPFLENCGCSRRIVAEWEALGIGQTARTFFTITHLINFVASFALAALLLWRRSDDRMAIFVSFTMLLFAGSTFPHPIFAPGSGLQVVDGLISVTGILSLLGLMCVFPDGSFASRWSRQLFIVIVIYVPIAVLLKQAVYPLFFLSLVVLFGLGVYVMSYRYRHIATPIQRQQMKWVLLALTVVFVLGIVLAAIQLTATNIRDVAISALVNDAVTPLAILLIPLSIAFSVLRYRLWDVDLTINRSLVYGAVTVLLAVVFIAIIAFVSALTNGEGSALGAILATGAAGLLFNPARKQAQYFVDRRIYHLNFDLNQLAAAQKLPAIQHAGALSGRKLGSYDVLDVIGKGGMGEVYKGQADGQIVALKVLPDEFAQQADFRRRFEREAQTLFALSHPNIVKILDSGSSEGVIYLAMEFIDGDELGRKIKVDGMLSLETTHDILRGLAAALDYAHQQGFVHRDIKPSNVMMRLGRDNETWQAVLMDFGVAKIREAQTSLTGTGAIGTIDYMAPEQIMTATSVDHHADIYALGVMAYEMLTGERPFKGSPAQVLFAHLQQPAPDPRDVNDDLPSLVAKAIIQAMAKKPEDRFSSAGEFIMAFSSD